MSRKAISIETRWGKIDGDHEFLMRAVLKIDTIREDLGSVGPVIAKQIEEAMLGLRSNLNTRDVEVKAATCLENLSLRSGD